VILIKSEQKVHTFFVYPVPPPPPTAFFIINIPQQRGTFVITDKTTLTRRHHPKSMVYIRVYSWCCIFTLVLYMDLHINVVIYTHHYCIIQEFHCPKNVLCSTCFMKSSFPLNPITSLLHNVFMVSIVFPFL